MIYLLTGTPGHGKTQRAIWMLLNDERFKGRPVLYANVRGLNADDERLKNWIPLTDVTQWETAPQGAVIFIDECHQAGFFPLRGVGKPPAWIEAIATHRHLGLDFVLVTQNAKNMDVFVRRLVELHIHCKRPAQMGYTNLYEFQSYTDCDDRIPVDSALRHSRWPLDKSIWTLYKSADEHTAKAKIPRIVYAIPLLLIVFLAAAVYLVRWAQSKQSPKPVDAATSLTVARAAVAAKLEAQGDSPVSLSRLSPQARVEHLMHETRDFQMSRVPLDSDYPESAPIYEELLKVKVFPRVAGCSQGATACRCVDQQGVPGRLSVAACVDFVVNGRFDPYRDEKREGGERSATNAALALGAVQANNNCSTYLVYGVGGSSTMETRCNAPVSSAASASVPILYAPVASSGAGSAGDAGAMPPPNLLRGGYVGSAGSPGNAAAPR